MQLISTKSPNVNKLTCLVFGESGVGKTTSIGTLPESRTLIAAGERSLRPLHSRNYPVLEFNTWGQIVESLNIIQNPIEVHENHIVLQIEDCKLPISVLAIDSLSEISRLCKKHIVEVDRKTLIHRRTGGKSTTPDKIYEDQMDIADWGAYGTRMTNLIALLGQLPVHVIVTCLSAWKEDQATKINTRMPNLQGSVLWECAAYFDLVMYAHKIDDNNLTEPQKYKWLTNRKANILAKNATGYPLEEVEIQDWTKLLKKILGNGAENQNREGEHNGIQS